MGFSIFKKEKESEYLTVAFYNLENLFDTHDDALTKDDDFCRRQKNVGHQGDIEKK